MTSKELYEKYKGSSAKWGGITGVVCGYVPDPGDCFRIGYSLLMKTDEDDLGWKRAANKTPIILDIDHMWMDGFWFVNERHITNKKTLWTNDDLLDVMNLGMDLRQNQLNGQCDRSGADVLNDWIERNSK